MPQELEQWIGYPIWAGRAVLTRVDHGCQLLHHDVLRDVLRASIWNSFNIIEKFYVASGVAYADLKVFIELLKNPTTSSSISSGFVVTTPLAFTIFLKISGADLLSRRRKHLFDFSPSFYHLVLSLSASLSPFWLINSCFLFLSSSTYSIKPPVSRACPSLS